MNINPIVIIGGGVIGLAIAYELAQRDHPVLILEKSECGGQATGAAAGMLAPYSELVHEPDPLFELAHQSLLLYPGWQAEIKETSGLDFEYNQAGSLYVVFHEADVLALETRLEWQSKWGVQAEIIDRKQLRNLEPELSDDAVAALYTPAEHHIYAPDYVRALYRACLKLGVQIEEETGDVQIGEVGTDGIHLTTESKGDYFAEQAIFACGAWTSFFEQELTVSLPIFPIRGQICAYRQEEEQVHHMVFSSQGYVLAKGNGTIVCGASEDIAGYDCTVTEQGIKRLMNWSRKLFPFLEKKEPFHSWAGLRPATQDGFPLIGRLRQHPNLIISSGHYRNGILLSPITAKIVADLIDHQPTLVDVEAYNPNRF